ncbi:MAG: hypothetical protein NWF01_11830 [Candidatus Bathyarchaeota archaeon]|nr:hypothetical protein [Candidatus Bathyarchaeota archaeon]
MLTIKKLFKNEYFTTVLIIVIMIIFVVGFFYGSQLFLNTTNPIVTVESGSMCIEYGGNCDGWSHPFDMTLHVGDILIIQGLKTEDYKTDYPNSDIIVYRDIAHDRLIVHRIVGEHTIDGKIYFYTKGDGNGPTLYPNIPNSSEYDQFVGPDGVSEDLVVGKVVGRIPWFGHITLFMDPERNPWGRPIVIGLIILLIVIEFILPLAKKGKRIAEQQQNVGVQT